MHADNAAGVAAAMDWLIAHGHTHIGFIGGPNSFYDAQQRLEAFERYVREHHLPCHPQWVEEGDFTAEGAKRCARRILSATPRPTAILAANDETAAGVLQIAQEMGIEVPSALSVIGFDDTPFAQVLSPRLSTVRQPLARIAEEAVDMLIGWIVHRAPPIERERMLPTELVLRDSTAPAPVSLSLPQGGL